jgi:hypothetical protein
MMPNLELFPLYGIPMDLSYLCIYRSTIYTYIHTYIHTILIEIPMIVLDESNFFLLKQ